MRNTPLVDLTTQNSYSKEMIGENKGAEKVGFRRSRRKRFSFAMPVSSGTEMTQPDATISNSKFYCLRR